MAKYSFEFKKSIVLEYLNGNGGYNYLTSQYNLGTNSQIRRWVAAYREFGDDGLRRSRKNNNYSFEFKLHVVELYLSSEVSYQELALSQGINNPNLIVKWVNDFRIAGPDALRPKKKGRKKTLNSKDLRSKSTTQKADDKAVDISTEHVRELEDELLKQGLKMPF